MSFDYRHTCPKIDKAIASAKDSLRRSIDDLLTDACGLLEQSAREELARKYADYFYADIESAFETVRETNEDMRKEADRQINALEDELAVLQSERVTE